MFRCRSSAALLLLLSLLLSLLCACGTSPNGGKEGIPYRDALGRDVTLPRCPQRVAALTGSFADVFLLAGGRVAATVDDAWIDLNLPLGEECISLGSTRKPSLEALLALEPDLVIASASTPKNVEWREILEGLGIPIVYFDVNSFEEYLSMLKICTEITDRPDLYRKNGTEIASRIEAAKAACHFENTPPDVLLLRVAAGFISVKGSEGTVLGEMLADIGCTNIADRDSSLLENLGMESILSLDPDYILIIPVGDDPSAVQEHVDKLFASDPAWQTLSAVRHGKVIYMDKQLFHLKPNARYGEAYETLITILTTK